MLNVSSLNVIDIQHYLAATETEASCIKLLMHDASVSVSVSVPEKIFYPCKPINLKIQHHVK